MPDAFDVDLLEAVDDECEMLLAWLAYLRKPLVVYHWWCVQKSLSLDFA